MISLLIPLILILELLLLYHKLGRMKEKLQAQLGSTALPVSSESSTSEKEPSLSDEDTTEMSVLLNVEEKRYYPTVVTSTIIHQQQPVMIQCAVYVCVCV